MRRQIQSFSIHQTSKVVGVLYLFIGLIAAVFLLVASLLGGDGASLVFALLAPVLYAALGYIATAVGCWIYNAIAGRVGGVEFVLAEPAAADRL